MPVTGGLFKPRYGGFGYWLLPRTFKMGNRKNLAYDARQIFALRTAPTVSRKFLHLRSNQAGAVQQEEQGMRKLEVKRKEKKLSIFCMYNGEHGVQVIQTFHGWDVCLFISFTIYALKNSLNTSFL